MMRKTKSRAGMTLLEVIVSMVLLAGVLLSLGKFSAVMSRTTGSSRLQATATQLVADRFEKIKGAATYAGIDSAFVNTENTITDFPGFKRKTTSLRIGGQPADTIDYKIMTVEVTHNGLKKPVRKSTVIAPF